MSHVIHAGANINEWLKHGVRGGIFDTLPVHEHLTIISN